MGKHLHEISQMRTTSWALSNFSKTSYQEFLSYLTFFPKLPDSGLEKSTVPLSWTSTYRFSSGQLTFHSQGSYLLTKSFKEQTKSCPRKAKFESYFSQRQAEFKLFLSPECVWLNGLYFRNLSLFLIFETISKEIAFPKPFNPIWKVPVLLIKWNVPIIRYNNTNLIMVRVVMSRATRVPCLSFFLSTCCDKIKQS